MNDHPGPTIVVPGPITRRHLHELVWSFPRTRLASAFGVTDVALGKICRKHGIPVPTRGWWAKRAAGGTSSRSRLSSETDPDEVVFTVKAPPGPDQLIEKRPDVLSALALVDSLEGDATYFHRAVEHPLVTKARRHYAGRTRGKRQRALRELEPEPLPNVLWIETSRSGLERALITMNRVLLAFAACGIEAAVGEGHRLTCFKLAVLGSVYRFRVREHWLDQAVGYGEAMESETTYKRFGKVYQCTGRLDLELHGAGNLLQTKARWRDGKKQRVEEIAWTVVRDTILHAHEERETRERWERRWAAEREEQAARDREIALRAYEQARFDLLLDQVEIWERASQLKRFAVECRATAAKENRVDERTDVWLRWVEENARKLNPFFHGLDAVREATIPRGS